MLWPKLISNVEAIRLESSIFGQIKTFGKCASIHGTVLNVSLGLTMKTITLNTLLKSSITSIKTDISLHTYGIAVNVMNAG